MAKMRVHELAKELEIESKVIVELLKGTEYEVKAAQSSVEDAAQDLVRAKYGKKAAPAPKVPNTGSPIQKVAQTAAITFVPHFEQKSSLNSISAFVLRIPSLTPNFLSRTTFLPLGPRVILTVSASLSTPRRRAALASIP